MAVFSSRFQTQYVVKKRAPSQDWLAEVFTLGMYGGVEGFLGIR